MSSIDRIPVLGALLRRLRGVWTLPVWRQAMRDDIAGLERTLLQMRGGRDDWSELPARTDDLAARVGALEAAGLLARIDRLRSGEASLVRSTHHLQTELDRLQSRLDALAGAWLTAGTAIDNPAADRAHNLLPEPLPVDSRAPLSPERLVGSRAALAHRYAEGGQPDASGLELDPNEPWAWPERLRQQARASLSSLVALDGFDRLQRDHQRGLLELARDRLTAGGWLALGLANPENLGELANLCRSTATGPLHPAAAVDLAAQAGLVAISVQRCDWPSADAPAPPSQEGGASALDLALQAPRRFLLIAHRAS